jgi:hypothetical protein
MNRITVAKTAAYSIAGIAAVSSYGHQVHLLGGADLDPLFGLIPSEWIIPLTVDSLAIVALMVRMESTVTETTRRWALLPLVLAGGLAIAANVAEARNIVQVTVGIWTVLSYIVAEIFVAKMERKATPVAKPMAVKPKLTEAEKAARKRAGYAGMSKAERIAWTRSYRERVSRRSGGDNPVSPGRVPVEELNADMAR